MVQYVYDDYGRLCTAVHVPANTHKHCTGSCTEDSAHWSQVESSPTAIQRLLTQSESELLSD